MQSNASSERIRSLLETAREQRQAGNVPKASEALREASHIDPENLEVKEAWLVLQSQTTARDPLEAIKTFLGSRAQGDEQKALQSIKEGKLGAGAASEAVGLLVNADQENASIDSLLTALISVHVEAKKALASRITENATEIYELVYVQGDASFSAFHSVALDDLLWETKKAQQTGQQDLFRLNIATLMEPGVDHPERAMRAIARQLAISSKEVTVLLDDDAFDVVLSSLDIRLAQSLRSQAMVAASKMLEATGEQGETLFSGFVAGKVSKATNDDLIIAFSAAAAVFPVIPTVAARLFMTDGFVQQLVPNLEKNSEAAAAGKRKSNTLEQAALELLSAACMDKACREAINRYCAHWLKALAEDREGMHEALAALVLAKVIGDSADSDVSTKLSCLVLSNSGTGDQAIEGLAYTSLQPKVKEEIASNTKLLRTLTAALKERPNVSFGCLTSFANICAYRPPQSEEQKKMAQLKAYANSSKLPPPDPLDNDGCVTVRCKRLLDADVVPALVACNKHTSSPSNVALITRILLSLSKEQKHRPTLAQQGAVKLLLQIRDRVSKQDNRNTIEHDAGHALARLLISVNPAHVFSSSLPVSTAVSALIALLSPEAQENEERNLLPTFESLLALTNLASMDDPTARDMILRVAWTTLENTLLLSSNALIQRASVELVCNLMASPAGVAKFADGSKQASNRMHILLALADVEDLATRRAAGGALAMLTEWDKAVEAVLEKERGVAILLGMCGDEDEGIRHRGLVCLLNIVNAPGKVGTQGVIAVKAERGAEVVKGSLKGTRNTEILSIGVEVLKKLV